MAKTEDYQVVGSYNNQRVSSIDAERSVNCFEYIDPLGKKPRTLINTSGLINTELDYGLTGVFRAQFVFNNFEYSVVANRVYRRDSSDIVTQLNTSQLLTTTTGYVGIDANTTQIIIVDGLKGYIYDTVANTFVIITDPAFPTSPIDVCTLDGFFVVANGNTPNFQLSSLNQGLIWGPDFTSGTGNSFVATSGSSPNLVLTSGSTVNYQIGTPIQFNGGGTLPAGTPAIAIGTTYYVKSVIDSTTFTISVTDGGTAITFASTGSGSIFVTNSGQLQQGAITTHPGNIIACRTLHRRLFLFSSFYYEVWENSGIGTNLPFRRNNSLLGEYGTTSASCISTGFDYMFFISQDRDSLGPVMQIAGTTPVAISNRALDFQLAQYAATTLIADCRTFIVKEDGLFFFRMNFTTSNHTFVYNVSLSDPSREDGKLWHEEEVLNGNRHPSQTHSFFQGKNYVGSYNSSTLYQISSSVFTNGAILDEDGSIQTNGEAIRRMRITKAIVPPGYQRIRIDRLQLDLLQGSESAIGFFEEEVDILAENQFILTTEDSIDIITNTEIAFSNPITPIVYLSISKDGGQTYGFNLMGFMGTAGETTFRTCWRKLGTIPRGQAFVIKIEFYDPVPFVVLGGSWAYEILPE